MKYRIQAKSRTSEGIHSRVHRLTIEAEHTEEREYLCWLTDMIRSGNTHQQYLEEQAKKPDALKDLTADDIRDAQWLWGAVCAGDYLSRSYDQMLPFQERGFIRDLERLPGRGRYAGRFEFSFTDKLQIVVLAANWSNPK